MNGAKISPLFDDVTALRIVRRDLRRTTDLLEAGDLSAARTFTMTAVANAVVEAEKVAEQVLVGQLWTDSAVQKAVA